MGEEVANGSVEDDAIESDLLAEELIAAEPVTITGTESPGNKGTPPASVLEGADGRHKDGRWRRGSVVNPDIGINDGKAGRTF